MKKLLIFPAVFSAFALGAKAELPAFSGASGTDFSGLEYRVDAAGNPPNYNAARNDDQQGTGSCFWMREPGVDPVIGQIRLGRSGGASRMLAFSTDGSVYRTASAVENEIFAAYRMDTVYADASVQFVPYDHLAAGSEVVSSGDKILVWAREVVGQGSVVGTNLMVTAGHGADNLSVGVLTDYTAALVITGFDANGDPITAPLPPLGPNEWHRLTVRSLTDIGSGRAGFVVFLDEKPVGTGSASDKGLGSGRLNALADRLNRAGALFPSMVTAGDARQSLTGMGLKGEGMLENVELTSTAPSFALMGMGKFLTLEWDAHVTAIAYQINGGAVVTPTLADHACEIPLAADFAGTVRLTTLSFDQGEFDPSACVANGCEISAGKEIVLAAGAAAAKLRVNALNGVCEVDGTAYATVEAAIQAAIASGSSHHPATIRLLADLTLEEGLYFDNGFVVFDLNGKTIRTVASDFDATITAGGWANLVLTNSVGTALVTANGPNGASFEVRDLATVAIYGDIVFESLVDTAFVEPYEEWEEPYSLWDLVLCGGTYADAGYPGSFYLADYVGAGYSVVSGGAGYAKVQKSPLMTAKPRLNERYHVPSVAEVAAETGYTVADAKHLAGEGATDEDRKEALRKVSRWANANGVSSEQVSYLAASPEDAELLADAYLLDCVPTEEAVNAAKSAFKGEIEVVEDGEPLVFVNGRSVENSETGSAYGNGRLIREGATTLENGGDWSSDRTGAIYFRYRLVR